MKDLVPRKQPGKLAPVTDAIPPANTPLKREGAKSSNFFSVYANDAQVSTTLWDVRVVLGEIGDAVKNASTGEFDLNVKEIGEVRLSPQLAKRISKILATQLLEYEKRFGPIPIAPEE